jgi:glycosyltransferase involved in cell wall biosynthesis
MSSTDTKRSSHGVPRLVVVSTYPPTKCGIATFSAALVEATRGLGTGQQPAVVRVIPTGDATSRSRDPAVIAEVHSDDPSWTSKTISSCRAGDILWIQHEYGIYGADDGVAVVDLAQYSPIPVAATLHTVPGAPTPRQKEILQALARHARSLVVMSLQARARLLRYYLVDPGRVHVVPHGAATITGDLIDQPADDRPVILNWGLIGPGKGLEWAIRAMPLLRHLRPLPRLVIRGITHPNVRRREGETYRKMLGALVSELGVEDLVDIESGYVSPGHLLELLRDAQYVLLPYDSTDQVTSGVLVEAVGAGIPVIATAFPHAVELLSGGAGTVVPHRDPEAIAMAIERYICSPATSRAAREESRSLAYDLSWPNVAAKYTRLARQMVEREAVDVA